MTALLSTEVQARLSLEKIEEDMYELTIKKGKAVSVMVITAGEAFAMQESFNLLIQKRKSNGTDKNS